MDINLEQLYVGGIANGEYTNEKFTYSIEIERTNNINISYMDIWLKKNFIENLKLTIDNLSPIITRTNLDYCLIEDLRGKEDFQCVFLSDVTVTVTRRDFNDNSFSIEHDKLGRRVLTFQDYSNGFNKDEDVCGF